MLGMRRYPGDGCDHLSMRRPFCRCIKSLINSTPKKSSLSLASYPDRYVMGLGLFAHIRVRIVAFFIRSEMKSWKRRSFLSRQSSQFARAADSRWG